MTVMAAEGKQINALVATTVLLVVFSMLFATLLMAFCAFRLTSTVWPPGGMSLPSLELPTLSTLLILASSAFYRLFERNFAATRRRAARLHYGACLLCALAFVFAQILLWQHLERVGILPGTNIFASVIYGFTWIHAAHIVGALGCLLWLLPTLGKTEGQERIHHVGKFWHLLTIVWLIMYGVIFVL